MTDIGATMPAAVYRGDRTVTVEAVDVPVIGPNDVLLEISHCGVCGTDLHLVMEGWGVPGSIHGHEYSGVVVAIGDDVTQHAVGDRVVGGPPAGCGGCRLCEHGASHLCLERPRAGLSVFRGAFARYMKVAATSCYRIPDRLDIRTAALCEPTAVALHGVLRAEIGLQSRVLVTGAGPIGLLTVAVLRAIGVEDVTVSEPNPKRRDLVRRVGASRVVTPDSFVAPELPMDVAVEPFDVAIECSGRPDAMEMALAQLQRRGTLVLSGTGMTPPRFDPNRIILNELVVTGSYEYVASDYNQALELLATGALPTDLLIEPEDVPLGGVQRAMERLVTGELAGKVLISPHR
jgi:(R,R)-butanediol dehydrogenase / meso-butanediol dehydrogenase / diacetyl reductase